MANEKRLIDANKIVMPLANYVVTNAYLNDSALDALKMVAKWIDEAPTVDAVEVVHGQWEKSPHAYGFVRCSVCHDCNIWEEWVTEEKWKFCPHCGAKMDGGSHEVD